MILHLLPGQGHNGAAHRKKIDTSPLEGWCLCRGGYHMITTCKSNCLGVFSYYVLTAG